MMTASNPRISFGRFSAAVLLCCAFLAGHAQSANSTLTVRVGKVAYKGDSIHHVIMPTLYKYPEREFKSEKERKQYNRLVMNV